jgi:pimeloyl-ACP methyl ester carboxylesterase
VIAVGPPARLPPDVALSRAYWDVHAEPQRKALAATRPEASDHLRRWYDPAFDSTELDRDIVIDFDWVQAIFDDAATVDWPATMQAVTCPVLLALGAFDFISPPTAWTPEVTPTRATTERFERSGHTPFVEQPDEFLDVVDRWLTTELSPPA